ncbi:branched-chain amino acid ABC transporter permease [Thalassobaculum fulvum]|uniref:Branched-chain amino acid ABC transporter permease n=1 Tax=Thalassobaculum fulvum TaxID=1633335 RepID=A0A919CP44_9PROT|nr:branched-chain amino acid ABC transporter permease [Thalassobaculum fulvum]GHD47083.1 branched-chain amino acid ABC transporter permease [Thalassobaculum fulvum]
MALTSDRTTLGLTVGFVAVALLGVFVLPDWLLNQILVAFSRALAVVGLLVLWRTGLVSFGHALYFGLGAYTVALLGRNYGIGEVLVTLPAATLASALVGFLLGFIVRRYREIFFAMLNLAFSMVLFGILVKTEALGSTDGFNVEQPTLLGIGTDDAAVKLTALFLGVCAIGWLTAVLVHRYLGSILGSLTTAVRDNEIRVEYLGYSAAEAIHGKYVMSAALTGLGGGFMAISLGQVDPESMVNWTVSGELVFVTILSGPGSVAAPFIGSLIFELLRTYAFELVPYAWQLIVGGTLLLIIFFLPGGVWSVLSRLAGRRGVEP